MGNEQSAPAPRGPRNKLSKPRTNSSVNTSNSRNSAAASRRNSHSEHVGISNSRRSTISVNVVDGEAGEKAVEQCQRKRMSLFRSKSAQPKPRQVDIGSGVDIEYLEDSGANWTTNSSVTEETPDLRPFGVPVEKPPIRTARMSHQHLPYSQHHQRLSLVPEAPSPLPELARQRQPEQQQIPDSPKTVESFSLRNNSDAAIYAPIRRKSLLQHGVATRNSWVENESRQSLPIPVHSQTDFQDYHYDSSRPTSSPLATIANLRSCSPIDRDIAPGPRVSTPNDLDYGHIGAFKLGSLRIMNGSASPAPSIERPATAGRDDDYIGAGESRRGHRHGVSQRSNTISVPPEIIKPPWITRSESPLRQEFIEESKLEPLTIETQLPLPELSLFKFTEADSPTKSLDLARDYMSDLAVSPFSFDNSPPNSPQFEATSKHMAVDDDLFEPEPVTPEVSEFRVHKSFDSGYHGENLSKGDKKVKGPRELVSKPLAKADSGYSSNVSLRSFKGNQPPPVPTKEAPPAPPKPVDMVPSSIYSATSSFYSTQAEMAITPKQSLPRPPVEDSSPEQPWRQPPPVPKKNSSHDLRNLSFVPPHPTKSPEQNWAAPPGPNVVTKQRKQGNSQRLSKAPYVSRMVQGEQRSNHSPTGSNVSALTSGTGSTSRWRSRSKSRPSVSPEPVFTVQAFQADLEQLRIPPVSAEASRKLEERVDAFPVSCFPNTERGNPVLRRTPSKETLGTIFSVGSAEWREELTYSRLQGSLPAVPVHGTIPETSTPTSESNRRHTYQPAMPHTHSQVPVRQSLQPAPRSNSALQRKLQQDFETEATSFNNISSGLGTSPYDAAVSSVIEAKRNQQARTKSMTAHFEADAAARYARVKTGVHEARNPRTLQSAPSYDSIRNKNPWAVTSNSENVHVSSREYTKHDYSSSHSQSNLLSQRSNPNFRNDRSGHETCHSFTNTTPAKLKSPPPVSLQTQRKVTPTHIGSYIVDSSSRSSLHPQQQYATPPNRTAPHPPAHISHRHKAPEATAPDPWEKQRNIWSRRKQEALQTRRSMEMRRPGGSQPSLFDPGPRSESAHPRMGYQRPPVSQEQPSHCTSFDNSSARKGGYESDRSRWEDKGYDHTYGSYEHNKENAHQEEYYDGPSQESGQLPNPQLVTNTSTSEMLILDRYAGGLAYGYEPGLGLVGSAGTRSVGNMANASRKSVAESVGYGLDFSDVPVFLKRVKIET